LCPNAQGKIEIQLKIPMFRKSKAIELGVVRERQFPAKGKRNVNDAVQQKSLDKAIVAQHIGHVALQQGRWPPVH
jgi:hypothetical protein